MSRLSETTDNPDRADNNEEPPIFLSDQEDGSRVLDMKNNDDDDKHNGEYATDRARPGKKPDKNTHRMNAQDQQYKQEFNMFDLDSSGSIDIKDLVKFFHSKVPEAVLRAAVKPFDSNRDGKISFNEYKTVRKLLGNVKLQFLKPKK